MDPAGMSKRPGSPGDSGRTAKRPAQEREQHLYLVVDDWERGYSIYRVGEDDFDSDADAAMDAPLLAASPLIRVEAQHPYSWAFAGHGTKIFAMQPSKSSPGVLVFDTETLGVTACPYPPNGAPGGPRRPVYASVGGRLVAFDGDEVYVLGPEPLPCEEKQLWSWTTAAPPAPFGSRQASSYALHPDGRTIFVSVRKGSGNGEYSRNSTFAFDTERLEWTHLGDWLLPFKGRAYYDGELDAWVGLCMYKEGAGHVCCCDVPPAAGAGSETMPVWKLGKDVFFDADSKRHLGATLVYMGDSMFCLAECRRHRDATRDRRLRVLKMTTVVLKYDKDGELCTTHHRAYASMSYEIAHERIDLLPNPVAFWM
ncbi:hypothetical protein ACP70R_010259 [Stipagrostis hirtigluma subsp. patula]